MTKTITPERAGARFHPGTLAITPAAAALFGGDSDVTVASLILRHVGGDWGTLDPQDHQANDRALRDGSRLLSQYEAAGERVWIITEASDDLIRRPSTTILTPDDY